MAGGMTRRDGATLAERVSRSGGRSAPPGPPGSAARHCWVVDAPGHPGRWPGLLVEWRRDAEGWVGRVVYAMPEPGAEHARVLERWLPAGSLQGV